MLIQQISVFLENRPGELAALTTLLADNGIDLRAIHVAETSDYGVLRLITNIPEKAEEILKEHGYVVASTPVVAVAVPDKVGGLKDVLQVMAQEKIDVEYMYSIFGQVNGTAHMIFRVEDPENFVLVLEHCGIHAATVQELGIC